MKKVKLIKLPKLSREELRKIKGGQIAPGCPCDCTCSSTASNGCVDGPGTLKSGS